MDNCNVRNDGFFNHNLLYTMFCRYLATTHTAIGRRLQANSQHRLYAYPLALVSIHMTDLAADLFENGIARSHFYNRVGVILSVDERGGPLNRIIWGEEQLKIYYEFVIALLIEFDRFYISSKPENLMMYPKIKNKFVERLKSKLLSDNACLLLEVRDI
jgi:hypothetical protein